MIRKPTDRDAKEIRALLEAAFGGPAEAVLVERLRADGDAVIELVADTGGAVSGHIMLSALTAPEKCLALAPVAVRPEVQNRGIGSALIERSLTLAREATWNAVFVLGEPAYYTRFGFSRDAASRFKSPYPPDYFMALAFQPQALKKQPGKVVYPAAFKAIT